MKNLEKLSILELDRYINWCESEIASTKELDLAISKMRSMSSAMEFERQGLPNRVDFLKKQLEDLRFAKKQKEISDLGLDPMLEFSYNFCRIEYAQIQKALKQKEEKEEKEKFIKELQKWRKGGQK